MSGRDALRAELLPLLVTWAALLGVLALQLGAALLLQVPQSASLFGLVSTSIVLIMFMRIKAGSPLMRIFGVAGIFWFAVLICLGTMDPVTRTDYPAVTDTPP
jgi:preprotein translocase subunit SecG